MQPRRWERLWWRHESHDGLAVLLLVQRLELKCRPNRLSYRDMAGTVEDAEDDDAEDAGDDSAGISNALGGGVGLPLARPAS